MSKVRATTDPIESPWSELKKFFEADTVNLIYNPKTDKYLVIAKKGKKTVRGIIHKEWIEDRLGGMMQDRLEDLKKRLNPNAIS